MSHDDDDHQTREHKRAELWQAKPEAKVSGDPYGDVGKTSTMDNLINPSLPVRENIAVQRWRAKENTKREAEGLAPLQPAPVPDGGGAQRANDRSWLVADHIPGQPLYNPTVPVRENPAVQRWRARKAAEEAAAKAGNEPSSEATQAAAVQGRATPAGQLPHADKIQASFGAEHDVSGVRAHVDPASTAAMGAEAYATGNDVVFAKQPDLRVAAHEAAHVVQQKRGVQLYGGVGQEGDAYERNADEVADRVVQGQSAADLLGSSVATGPDATTPVQRKEAGRGAAGGTDGTAAIAGKVFAIFQACFDDAEVNRQKWVNAAEQFGLCYCNAYKSQHDAVEKQKKADQLAIDICFGVLSAVVLGGALGGLKKLATNHAAYKAMTDWKAEGLLGASAGLVSGLTQVAKPKAESYQVATHPLHFYLQLRHAVDTHYLSQLEWINQFVQFAKDAVLGKIPATQVATWNPAALDAAVNAWKSTVIFYKAPPEVPTEALTKELEIGLWAKWAPHLARSYEVMYCGSLGRQTRTDYSGPGRVVEHRLDALGITAACGASWGTIWDSDSDIEKFVNWGASWQPSHTFTV